MESNTIWIRLLVACAAVAAALAAVPARAQGSGYLTDQRGAEVRNSTGLCWRTGSWTPAMANERCDADLVPKKPALPPIAKPAPAAPVPAKAVAPPPKPMPVVQKMTLAADTLFDFDKAVIRPAGKTRLDELVAKLKDVTVDTVIAVGHTDRMGSDTYNLKLSVRRADAAKAYLVSKGVPAGRIHAE